MVAAMTSPRCSRSRLVSARLFASRSRSTMVSRNTITVLAIWPISSLASVAGMRAAVSRAASRFIASATVERTSDAAADPEAEAQADKHRREADPQDDGLGAPLRRRKRRRGRVAPLLRGGDDLVRLRQHALA